MPQGFKDYIANNEERIKVAEKKGTLPYFIKDNKGVVDEIRKGAEHSQILISNEKGGKKGVGSSLGSRKAEKEGWEVYSKYDSTVQLSKVLRRNAVYIKDIIGDKSQLVTRNFEDADNGIPNKIGGDENCVNVILANEMLRRGINVTAKIDYVSKYGEDNYTSLFLSKHNKEVHVSTIIAEDEKVFLSKVKKEIHEGRYVLGWNDYNDAQLAKKGIIRKECIGGHVLTAEMTPFGLQIYDHQDKCFVNVKTIFQNMDLEQGMSTELCHA